LHDRANGKHCPDQVCACAKPCCYNFEYGFYSDAVRKPAFLEGENLMSIIIYLNTQSDLDRTSSSIVM
jgi:hypothetical protein